MLQRKGPAFIPTLKDGVFPLCYFQSPEEKPIELEKLNLILEDGTGTSLAVADVLTQLVIGGTTSAAVLGAWHYYRLRKLPQRRLGRRLDRRYARSPRRALFHQGKTSVAFFCQGLNSGMGLYECFSVSTMPWSLLQFLPPAFLLHLTSFIGAIVILDVFIIPLQITGLKR